MIWVVLQNLKSSWPRLVLMDILFKGLAFVLLTPLVSLMFRGFLAVSGREILADVDIAKFLLHPIGWAACPGSDHRGSWVLVSLRLNKPGTDDNPVWLRHIRRNAWELFRMYLKPSCWKKPLGILKIAAWMVARILVLAAPFMAVGGGIYLFLLTDHDINYRILSRQAVEILARGVVLIQLRFWQRWHF